MDIHRLIQAQDQPQPDTYQTFHPYAASTIAKRSEQLYGPEYFRDLELLADAAILSSPSSEVGSDHSSDTFNSFSNNAIAATSLTGVIANPTQLKRKQVTDAEYDAPNVKPKRKRANSHQIKILKETFQATPFPSSEFRRELAQQLEMTPRSVQIWFQNQRQLMRNVLPLRRGKELMLRTESAESSTILNCGAKERQERERDIAEHGQQILYSRRHVILPKELAKYVPKDRLLTETEWRTIGVQQSPGWIHYMIHNPEPHILLFRREKDYQTKYTANGTTQH